MAPGTVLEPQEGLLDLQLRIARRADEFARDRSASHGLNLHCWLLAEREILSGELADWIAEPALASR